MGGTSFDVSLITEGFWKYAEEPIFDRFRILQPIAEIESIGAGGGTIARVDEVTGRLLVGPQSAGARPGPVCYDEGGEQVTVTDVDVLLGYIDPDYFLGGRIKLDRAGALAAVTERIADPLGIAPEAAAAAIVEIANAQMSDLIRKITVERGLDPAAFTIFAYGGAGGLHVGAYAQTLGCRHVVVPAAAAVFSAFGIGMSDVKRVAMASDPMRAPFDLERWRRNLDQLRDSLERELRAEQLPTTGLAISRFVELQFRGQVHSVRVPVDDDDLAAGDGGERVIDRFADIYESRYGKGSAYRQAGVEAVTFAVEGAAALPVPDVAEQPDEGADAAHAISGRRNLYLHAAGGFREVAAYSAEKLRVGNALEGPALVEAEDTTVLVQPGQRLWVDGLGNLRIDLPPAEGWPA
jgi:N-methylhydantoinase A